MGWLQTMLLPRCCILYETDWSMDAARVPANWSIELAGATPCDAGNSNVMGGEGDWHIATCATKSLWTRHFYSIQSCTVCRTVCRNPRYCTCMPMTTHDCHDDRQPFSRSLAMRAGRRPTTAFVRASAPASPERRAWTFSSRCNPLVNAPHLCGCSVNAPKRRFTVPSVNARTGRSNVPPMLEMDDRPFCRCSKWTIDRSADARNQRMPPRTTIITRTFITQ